MAGRQIDDINVFPAMSRHVWWCLTPKITPQGLEPQLTEPESVVLPITPRGNVVTFVFEVRQSISASKRCKE